MIVRFLWPLCVLCVLSFFLLLFFIFMCNDIKYVFIILYLFFMLICQKATSNAKSYYMFSDVAREFIFNIPWG